MRKLLAAAAAGLCCAGFNANAETYFVDSIGGNDGNTGKQVNNVIAAWQTLTKVNGPTLQPGDIVVFKRGSSWPETLLLRSSVTYSVYGDPLQPKPVFTGAVSVGNLGWTPTPSAGVYVADTTNLALGPDGIKQLFLDQTRLPRARHPNAGGGDFGTGSAYFASPTDGLNLAIGPKLPSGTQAIDMEVYARTAAWQITHYTVNSYVPSTGVATLKAHPENLWDYPPKAGYGYWLENRSQFIDQPGEWAYHAYENKLYVRLPDGGSPQGRDLRAAVRPNAIYADQAKGFLVDSLDVRETSGDAVKIVKAGKSAAGQEFGLGNLEVRWAGGRGVSITGSQDGWIASSLVEDSLRDGIWMGQYGMPCTLPSFSVHAIANTVRRAGKGYFAAVGIGAGHSSYVEDNVVEETTLTGIGAWHHSVVQRNLVRNSCAVLDDCAGISVIGRGFWDLPVAQVEAACQGQRENYVPQTWTDDIPGPFDYRVGQPLHLYIGNNVIEGGVHSTDGIPSNSEPSAKGIYTDDWSNTVLLENNFIANVDDGFHLHNNRYVIVRGNTSFGARRAPFFMQENTNGGSGGFVADCNRIQGTGDCDINNYMLYNTIEDNLFVSTRLTPTALLTSDYASTDDFGTFTGNRYVALADRFVVQGSYKNAARSARTFAQWQSRHPTLKHDLTGAQKLFAPTATVVGAPLAQFNFETGDQYAVWTSESSLNRDYVQNGCPTGWCLRAKPQLQTGGGNINTDGLYSGNVHTGNIYTVDKGEIYRLSFRAKGVGVNSSIMGVLAENHFAVSDGRPVELTESWQNFHRYLRVFKKPTITQDQKARLDLYVSSDGRDVLIDDIKVEKVLVTTGEDASYAFYNAGNTDSSHACPAVNQARCSEYVDARTGDSVEWPLVLSPWTSAVVIWDASPFKDGDQDGVPNATDSCLDTELEAGVLPTGCAQ